MISRIEQRLDDSTADQASPADTATLESLSRVLERLIRLNGQHAEAGGENEDQQLREAVAARVAKALKGRTT